MTKRATAQQVAKLAGVSRTTVSFVLNNTPGMRISEETRQRVLAAAAKLNYHPNASARRMATGRTRVIGLVLRQTAQQAFATGFLLQVLNGLNSAASQRNYHLLLEPIPPDNGTRAYSKLIRERHVDGIIVSGPRFDDEELLQIRDDGAPLVLIGQFPRSNIPSVDVDNCRGAQQATEHLIQLGHRRIGFISNAPPVYTAAVERQEGYQLALEIAGIAFDNSLIQHGAFTAQSGFAAMNALLELPQPPDAAFVASDTVAHGALQAISLRGLRVPDDIAVVGFDDVPASEYIEPPLTTVRLPAYNLGWGAADLLINIIEGQTSESTEPTLLETELIIRKSCGASHSR